MNINIEQFKEQGFLIIDSTEIFTEDELSHEIDKFNEEIPRYENYNGILIDDKPNTVILSGSPLAYRLLGGLGPIKKGVNENPLYGRRAVKPIQKLNDPSLVENLKILKIARLILESNDIVIHNGSYAASYPASTGNSGQYHADTINFTDAKTAYKAREKNNFVLNILIYLSDVDEKLAPLRLIPRTHNFDVFKHINKQVGISLGVSNEKVDNLSQENWIYDELVDENYIKNEIKVKGKKGTIILMNSSLLHAATENYHVDKTRKVVILNFGRAKDRIFRRRYSLKDSKTFISKIKNKSILQNTFQPSASVYFQVFNKLKKLLYILIKKIHRKVIIRIMHPGITIDRIKYQFEEIFHKITDPKRNYLNIGSGQHFHHYKFINFDFKLETIPGYSYHIDLGSKPKYPLSSNSVGGIYTSHCLEHLMNSDVHHNLSEAFRVLKKNGIIRIVVPDIEAFMNAYKQKDAAYYQPFREKSISNSNQVWRDDSWIRLIVRSFAGHIVDQYDDAKLLDMYKKTTTFDEFIDCFTQNENVNVDFKNAHQHMSAWSFERMKVILTEIGFVDIKKCTRRESSEYIFRNKAKFNNTQPFMSLFIEARK